MIKTCPDCQTALAMSIQPMKNKKGGVRLRPLKSPFLSCAQVACRLIINVDTGDIYERGKLRSRK